MRRRAFLAALGFSAVPASAAVALAVKAESLFPRAIRALHPQCPSCRRFWLMPHLSMLTHEQWRAEMKRERRMKCDCGLSQIVRFMEDV